MRSILGLLLLFVLVGSSFSQTFLNALPAPDCSYTLDSIAYSGADSIYSHGVRTFTGADSSFYPVYYNGERIKSCKGFTARDTGVIVFKMTRNTTDERYSYHVTEDLVGVMLPIQFNKMFESGSTIGLKDITVFPILP
jgi:hypothetical protein